MGQPTRPTQPSIPLGSVNGRQAAYGWLVIGQSVGAGLAYSLQALHLLSL